MGKWFAVLVLIAVAGSPLPTWAHGPQIQIVEENGKIVTRALLADEPYNGSITPAQRVYQIPLLERNLNDANDGWYATPNVGFPFSGPGFATALGGFETGSVLSLTFTDGLKIWNGSIFVDPGAEQMDVYRGVTHVAGAITTDSGPFQSFSYTPFTNVGDEHKETFVRLLGKGLIPDSPSDNGVYLLSLRLMSNEAGVQSSQPFFYLLSKNASGAQQAAALAYVNANLLGPVVPAVSEWGVAVLALALLSIGTIAFQRGALYRKPTEA